MAEQFKMEDEASSVARTRQAFADRNDAFNELRSARVDQAAARLQNVTVQTDAEEAAAARALENGNWDDHARHQRRLSELAVARADAERAKNYFESQPVYERDPVEALIQSKSSEPETVAWLRAHPSDALALATGGAADPRRAAKIQASHADAIAQGHTPGSTEYFRHVDKFLGTKSAMRGSGTSGGTSGGGATEDEVRLTAKEAQNATDGTLIWNYSDPTGQNRWQKGSPIGLTEMARRKKALREQGAYDRLD